MKRLGAEWSAAPLREAEDSVPIRHRPTRLSFVVVPGGRFAMGLSEADCEEARRHVDLSGKTVAVLKTLKAQATPVHPVAVKPFLCARKILMGKQVPRLSRGRHALDCLQRADAIALAASLGLRLPSEAELEWIGRDGGRYAFLWNAPNTRRPRSRFGIEHLFFGQWAADDWHDDYRGAPHDGSPWFDGDSAGCFRGGQLPEEMQSPEELIFLLSAARGHGRVQPSFVGLRLARDL